MEFSILIAGASIPTTKREYKGNSLIAFPDNYCMVDLETTGYSPIWDDIIEIGAIRYSGGKPIEQFQTLVQPPQRDDGAYVDEFIEELTGITNEMLASAPSVQEAIVAFSEFLGDSLIVGYNVNFDVNFLYDQYLRWLEKPLSNDFIDVMRIAKKIYPEMPHHRLKDMLAVYNLVNAKEHRTISDCEATQRCYEKLHEDAIQKYGDEDSFIAAFAKKRRRMTNPKIHGDEAKNNPDCPLYQKHCVITGKLERFTRADALQLIADLGGIIENGVTKKTDYLILGNNDYCSSIKDGKSSKHKKAEAYILKGQDIEIIPEAVFYDIIADYILHEDSEC